MTRKDIYTLIEKDDGSNVSSHVYGFSSGGFSWFKRR